MAGVDVFLQGSRLDRPHGRRLADHPLGTGGVDLLNPKSIGLFCTLCELLLLGSEQIGQGADGVRLGVNPLIQLAVGKDERAGVRIGRHHDPALLQKQDGVLDSPQNSLGLVFIFGLDRPLVFCKRPPGQRELVRRHRHTHHDGPSLQPAEVGHANGT
jgi:hypothetical protein